MKILQINCVYGEGSTGHITQMIHEGLLKDEKESVVICGRRAPKNRTNIYPVVSEIRGKINQLWARITGVKYGGCILATKKIKKHIKSESPDIVHLQCINGNFVNIYSILSFLKKQGVKTVLTLHAEFMYTANCGHAFECIKWKTGCGNCPRLKKETKSYFFDNTRYSWLRMKEAFEDYKNLIVVSVSPWLQSRAQMSPFLCDKKHITILNGINTKIFHQYLKSSVKSELGIEDKKVVLHVTAAFNTEKDHIKGGYYVVELAKMFLKTDNNVIFLVAGKCNNCKDMPTNMIFLGNISNQSKLAEYYSIADVTLLTSKKETFSMVVAESLCCGTPVVGFEAGAPEMIAIDKFSSFVSHGETEELYNELKRYLYCEDFDRNLIAKTAKLKYEEETMLREYKKIYELLIENSSI